MNAVVDGLIGRVRAMTRRFAFGEVDKLAARERTEGLPSQLDLSYSNRLRRRARRWVYATGRRSQSVRGPSARIGEAYRPPIFAAMAED